MSHSHDQTTSGTNGELQEPGDEEDEGEQTNDFGDEQPWFETAKDHRRDVVTSLLQSAIRRSDDEVSVGARGTTV
jgi:hypothetical protein